MFNLDIGPIVDRLFDIVDRDKSGTLDQNEVAAAGKLMAKWKDIGNEGWDTPENLTEMLTPVWLLLANSPEDKVTLHAVLKLVATLLECLVTTTVSLEEVWGLSIPKAVPKTSDAVFEMFKASKYDLDKNGTLSFDEAIGALQEAGLLQQIDEKLGEMRKKTKEMKEKLEHEVNPDEETEDDKRLKPAASRFMDAQSIDKIIPKIKEQLNALKT